MSVMAQRTVVVRRETCCSSYHQAVELVGKRWTGAILFVLMDGPTRFSEFKRLVPDLSDRLLSERMKELEAEGIVERRVIDDTPIRVEYVLTDKGEAPSSMTATSASYGSGSPTSSVS
jgi:DNA-binding HxlR family transcriptional regulator